MKRPAAMSEISWYKILNTEGLQYIEPQRAQRTRSFFKFFVLFVTFVVDAVCLGFTLKFGMLFVGVSLGILSGSLLSYSFQHEEVAYFSMILLFGGIALIANAILERKAQEKNQD